MRTKADFLKALAIVAKRCTYDLDEYEAKLYVQQLESIGWDKAVGALERIYMGLKGGARALMPSINDVLQAAGQATPADDTLVATDIATRIVSSVARFTSAKPDRAREHIGEVGWAVMVQYFGSWRAFCDVLTYDNQTTMIAQLRETARAMIEKQRRGIPIDAAPQLTATTRSTTQAIAQAVALTAKLTDKNTRRD